MGKDPTDQSVLDMMMVKELDGSESEWGYTKGKLGANSILAVSIALCKAGAEQQDKPLWKYIADMAGVTEPTLPVPAFNIINGGSHAGEHTPQSPPQSDSQGHFLRDYDLISRQQAGHAGGFR